MTAAECADAILAVLPLQYPGHLRPRILRLVEEAIASQRAIDRRALDEALNSGDGSYRP